jgi:hypothetical protein
MSKIIEHSEFLRCDCCKKLEAIDSSSKWANITWRQYDEFCPHFYATPFDLCIECAEVLIQAFKQRQASIV